MKLLLFAFLACSLATQAQRTIISVGNSPSLLIKNGTIFSADSLVLTPGADFTLSSNNIQVSPVAVNIAPNPSINRVYYLGSQISFTGTIQLYYQPSELNGNTESQLQYTDSATSAAWLAQSASTVNTGSHYVQYSASSKSFIASTASNPSVALALSIVSFTGNWDHEAPALAWVVDQTDENVNFNIESSADGVSWKNAGEVNGRNSFGLNDYQFNDYNAIGLIMYYRIRLLEISGQSIYSYVVKLQKGDHSNDIRLIIGNGTVSVHFTGDQPSGIRLLSAVGQILRSDRTSRQEYDLSGLIPGVYLLQYELNGQWAVREFVVR